MKCRIKFNGKWRSLMNYECLSLKLNVSWVLTLITFSPWWCSDWQTLFIDLFINLSECCHIFRGCVSDLVVTSYAVGFVYISRDSWVLCLILLCSLMMCTNNRVQLWHDGRSHLLRIALPHHYADVCEGIELLKCLSYAFCPSVC